MTPFKETRLEHRTIETIGYALMNNKNGSCSFGKTLIGLCLHYTILGHKAVQYRSRANFIGNDF